MSSKRVFLFISFTYVLKRMRNSQTIPMFSIKYMTCKQLELDEIDRSGIV